MMTAVEQEGQRLIRQKGDPSESVVLHYDQIPSPIGPLVLVAGSQGLCSIEFGTFEDNEEKLRKWAARWFGPHEFKADASVLQPVREQLEQYFRGERTSFDYELDLRGTDFQKRVWHALLDVDYGTTVSYKTIAEAIGAPKAVRAVGGANNKNPIPVIIPCHRIIGASGELVGYGGGLDVKIRLLQLEGMDVK